MRDDSKEALDLIKHFAGQLPPSHPKRGELLEVVRDCEAGQQRRQREQEAKAPERAEKR